VRGGGHRRRPRRESASLYQAQALTGYRELAGLVDAAIVAVPTTSHESVAGALLEAGIDVLVEKPIAPDMAAAGRLVESAARHGRISKWATWSATTPRWWSWNGAPLCPCSSKSTG